MARVYSKTKSTRGRTYRCQTCHEEILAGEGFYEWSRRFGRSGQTYRQHQKCGRPRPTQLSSRKTAALEEAVNALDFSSFNQELDVETLEVDGGEIEIDVADLEALLEEIADAAREIAEEYQAGFDNLPENFQYGPTGEAMQEVAQELESWADDLVDSADLDGDFSYDALEVDEDATEEEQATARDEWQQATQDAFEEKLQELRDNAESVCTDWPEYQG